ncbi:MAG: family 43 glycosylhydrolase [Verrucomicrobia bacterium]|nr:family 43 glycosylhydrolase [Verrucomicrobiota bacterium]
MPTSTITSIRTAFSFALVLASCASAQLPSPKAYPNPLPFSYTEGQSKEQREVRDPCIIREGDTYYLIFTMHPFSNRDPEKLDRPNQGGSPGIALYSSKDLTSWTFENWLVKSSDLPENSPYKNRFWAPEIHKINGKFYLIFTADNWIKPEYNPAGNWGSAGYAFVGVADRITGPYQHITYIPGGACDTSLFADTDGKTYAVMPRGNIDIQEIDLTRLSEGKIALVNKPKLVVTAKNTDIGSTVTPEYLEGPWMEKIDGRYYLFHAAIYRDAAPTEWRGYWVNVAVADNILGPYQKDPRGRLFLGGHAAIFDRPDGSKWFSYRNEVLQSPEHGKLCVDPFIIDAQGRIQTPGPAQQISR